ncbi:MAG: histidine kinase, partial [Mycobacterium sp.]
WVYAPALIFFAVLMPLYFPDGRLPSSRWRPVVWSALVLVAVTATVAALTPRDAHLLDSGLSNPYGVAAVGELGVVGAFLPGLLWLSLVIAATTSLVLRFRRGTAVKRAQIAWLAFAMVITAAVFVLDAVLAILAPQIYPVVFPFIQIVPVAVPIAATIAILRYRLFDIDRLINRTLLYGLLTACVIGIYVVIVGGIGAVVDAQQGDVGLSLLATGVVAVSFGPLRDRLQRSIDRLVYGDRADPYRTLAMLGRRLEESQALDAVLPSVAATVADALRVPYAAVQVSRGPELGPGRFQTAAEHGSMPGPDVTMMEVPLTYGGEQVGRLVLAGRGRSVDLSPADRRVLADLGRQIGIAVQATEVERRARGLSLDLQQSRERLVLAREEERRRIGRDLHDGLGPQLAGLTMTLEAARDLVRTDPTRAEELLGGLLGQADLAIEDVRRISHQLRPPALDALGLVGALRSHATSQRIPVTVQAPAYLPGLPAGVEVAAYRIALEAVHNVVTHAAATACRVTLRIDRSAKGRAAVLIEVNDNGVGIPADLAPGIGLASMAERAEELGGTFVVAKGNDGGTQVQARLPIPVLDESPTLAMEG